MTQPDSEKPVVLRALIGGALMGLANLVPGISGGTMLLVSGVYESFVRGVAAVTTFRWRLPALVTLGCIVVAAMVVIIGLAGPVGELVVHRRWIMYSLFIGLTLGGVPAIWPMVRPLDGATITATLIGIAPLAAIAFAGSGGGSASGDGDPAYVMLFVAGVAGAAAMVLPGVSGAYLLLLLGQYVPILNAVGDLKDALRAGDTAAIATTMHTIVPVGLGVLVGVVGISNLIKILLERWQRATAAVLLGLLLGAVLGLWPFQQGVAPAVGDTLRNQQVIDVDGVLSYEQTGKPVEPEDYPVASFRPTPIQAGGAIGLVLLGVATSVGIAHVGRR